MHTDSVDAPGVGEYLPGTQSAQSEASEAPAVRPYLPEAQSVQAVAPTTVGVCNIIAPSWYHQTAPPDACTLKDVADLLCTRAVLDMLIPRLPPSKEMDPRPSTDGEPV